MLIGIDGNEANVNQKLGSNVYAFELIKALSEIKSENEYKIYLRETPKQNLPNKSEKLSYKVLKPKKLWTRWRLPSDLYLSKPQPNLFFTPGHYSPRFSPCPTVCSILDLSFLTYPKSFKPLVLRQLKKWTFLSAKNAAHILTISQATKKDIISKYKIPSSKITVTYPGISDQFRTTPTSTQIQQVKSKYKINSNYLIFIGTQQPKKNLNRLIKAFNQLSIPNLRLVIVGKIWKQFAKQKHSFKSASIIKTGFVPNADLSSLIKGARGLILPSLYEGFGFPVAQAMALGTPTVVSNVSSLPEIVGDSGIQVNPLSVNSIAQGIKQVLSLSSEKKVKLINNAKKRAQEFSWEKCAQKTMEVLNEAAN